MKPTKSLFATLAITMALYAQLQAQNTTYVWQSTDGDPHGLAGTIVLDSPSSAGGTMSDVVSVTLSDPVAGTYHVAIGIDPSYLLGGFTWTPTMITRMNAVWQNGSSQNWETWALPNDTGIQNGTYGLIDEGGAWLAEPTSVPEPSVSLLLFSTLAVWIFSCLRLGKGAKVSDT
jgi:hypothetical protein